MEPEYIKLHPYARRITGERFGRLVALGPVRKAKGRNVVWRCQCDCGNFTEVQVSKLREGGTQSCGCLIKEVQSRRFTTHGLSSTRAHEVWSGIVQRCTNPNYHRFVDYGGRGITMFGGWRNSFESFYEYVSQLPSFNVDGLSLDRINNNGNYEPGNVRWATQTEQQRNTRVNKMITYDGRTQCVAAWADEIQIDSLALGHRIRRGWDIERALTAPVRITAPTKRSEHKGVHWHKATGKWQAQITADKKNLYLGVFDLESDALEAYLAAVLEV